MRGLILIATMVAAGGQARAWEPTSWPPWDVPNGGVPFCVAPEAADATNSAQEEEFLLAVVTAADSWTAPCSAWCAALSRCSGPGGFAGDGVNWIYWEKAWPGDSLTLAATAPTLNGLELVDIDILFNDRDFSWALSPQTTDPHIETVARHEMGHALGLGHYDPDGEPARRVECSSGSPPSVMCTYYEPTTAGGEPTADDLEGLCTLYPGSPSACAANDDGASLSDGHRDDGANADGAPDGAGPAGDPSPGGSDGGADGAGPGDTRVGGDGERATESGGCTCADVTEPAWAAVAFFSGSPLLRWRRRRRTR